MIQTAHYWVAVVTEPLELLPLYQFVLSEDCGAVDIFVGTVRNHGGGRAVARLEYHGYPEMGEKVLEHIVRRTRERWNLHRIAVFHRIGLLELTEASVIIVVSSPHRAEAFEACRFIIEEIKKDLPVWKKEHFVDGQSEWKSGS